METKKFLERVLGDGYYSVLGLGDKKVQSFHATIDDVTKTDKAILISVVYDKVIPNKAE